MITLKKHLLIKKLLFLLLLFGGSLFFSTAVTTVNAEETMQSDVEGAKEAIKAAMEERKPSLDISSYHIQRTELLALVNDIIDHNPGLFYASLRSSIFDTETNEATTC